MHLKIQDGVQDGYQNDQFCSNFKYFTICYGYKMEQNQNDNASNVVMANTFRCHINSWYHCFKVPDGVRDDCQLIVSDLVDTFIII